MSASEFIENVYRILRNWDPLQRGIGAYEMEIGDVIQAALEIDDVKLLSKRIQFIYEFSFNISIPINACQHVARKILSLKVTDFDIDLNNSNFVPFVTNSY